MMINNSKNNRLKNFINSKILYTLPLAGIGIIGTQQTTNAMFNPNGRAIPQPSTTYRTTLSMRITSNKTTSTSSKLSTNTLSNAPSNPEKITSPIYHYLHLGNDMDHNQTINIKHTSSLTSRFLNPNLQTSKSSTSISETKAKTTVSTTTSTDTKSSSLTSKSLSHDLPKSTTSPTSTSTTESSQINLLLNYKPTSKNYKMTVTKITYIDDDASTSSSQTKITKPISSSQSVSSLEERPSSPTSSNGK